MKPRLKRRQKVTEQQKSTVHFCEDYLHISFEGNIEDIGQVDNFIAEYLDEAQSLYNELKCEYEAYLEDL